MRPSHGRVRMAVDAKYSAVARAIRPFAEPLLAQGYTWSEIGQAIERHLKAGTPGAEAPTSAKRPTDKPASGSDGPSTTMFTPRARPYVWDSRDSAPIKTN